MDLLELSLIAKNTAKKAGTFLLTQKSEKKIIESEKGRDIKLTQIPASLSLSNNIPNHTENIHIVSQVDSQKLIDTPCISDPVKTNKPTGIRDKSWRGVGSRFYPGG